MIHFSHPILLLLAVPAWLVLRRGGQAGGIQSLLRATLVALLVIVAAGPTASTVKHGTTVVMVFDRSRSMPATIDRFAKDLMRRAEGEMGPGDQLAAVGFGAAPLVEQFPAVGHPPETGLKRIDPERSNLFAAIDAALHLVPAGQEGRLIVVSDGLADDAPSDSLVDRLRRRRVPVSFMQMTRRTEGDVVLESVACPTEVPSGTEIAFEFQITAREAGQRTMRIRRDGDDLPAQSVEIEAGTTRLTWRDQAAATGVVRYSFALDVAGDPTIENNQWDAWVRVRGEPTVLVLNADGGDSPLAELVRRAGADVQILAAKHANISVERLSGFEACVIEDVPVADLAAPTVQALGHYVERLGGGLVVSGGTNGLGAGGFRFGALESLLPVRLRSLSAKERSPIALVLVVDTNAWEAAGLDDEQSSPLQKAIIALAQELDAADRIAITATRSSNQVVLTLSPTGNLKVVRDAVDQLGVPGDPSLFPRALDAALDMLAKSPLPEKHLVACIGAGQFAGWQAINDPARAAKAGNVTTTVVSWGAVPESWNQTLAATKRAKRSLRQVSAGDASQLADLLRQDFEVRTGGGFVDRATAMLPLGESGLVDPDANLTLPVVRGFHPAMLRSGSRATLVTRDNPNVPLAAESERGLGRVSTILFPVERGTSSDVEWEQLARILVGQLQWTARLDDASRSIPVNVEWNGRAVNVSLKLSDAEAARLPGSGPLELDAASPEQDAARVTVVSRSSVSELDATVQLERMTGCVPVVRRGQSFILRGPPVSLPRSREFLRPTSLAMAELARKKLEQLKDRFGDEWPDARKKAAGAIEARVADMAAADDGGNVLNRLAELSGGGEWTEGAPLFNKSGVAQRSLVPFFGWMALALLLLDIADRRHHILDRLDSGLRRAQPRREPSRRAGIGDREVKPTEDIFEQAKQRTRRRLQR